MFAQRIYTNNKTHSEHFFSPVSTEHAAICLNLKCNYKIKVFPNFKTTLLVIIKIK